MLSHIYLSPHLDDAVFSCGGLIDRQVQSGDAVSVLTICAGEPPPGESSDFAEELHARWGVGDHSIAARKSEDLAACGLLGAAAIHMDVPDAIYRRAEDSGPLYVSERAIFGSLAATELGLVEQVARALQELITETAVVYCPLAVGGHVDHRLARRAAERLERTLHYYEELPYAARQGTIPSEFARPTGPPRRILLTSTEIDRWIEASTQYRSQISTFWSDEISLGSEIRRFHDGREGLLIGTSDPSTS